jgi:hypothetical protein
MAADARLATDILKGDRDFVLAAVAEHGYALQYCRRPHRRGARSKTPT